MPNEKTFDTHTCTRIGLPAGFAGVGARWLVPNPQPDHRRRRGLLRGAAAGQPLEPSRQLPHRRPMEHRYNQSIRHFAEWKQSRYYRDALLYRGGTGSSRAGEKQLLRRLVLLVAARRLHRLRRGRQHLQTRRDSEPHTAQRQIIRGGQRHPYAAARSGAERLLPARQHRSGGADSPV